MFNRSLPDRRGRGGDGLWESQVLLGADKSAKTTALEVGAKLLQSNSPLGPMDIYLVGFHPTKECPELQMEAHHFCHQVNRDFVQYSCLTAPGSQ